MIRNRDNNQLFTASVLLAVLFGTAYSPKSQNQNTDGQQLLIGRGLRLIFLPHKMSGALLQFMKTGNPNGGGLPDWKPYTPQNGESMIWNDNSELKNDPDKETRKSLN